MPGMLDPWSVAVEMLLGAYVAPAVRWPTDRVRLVVARDDDSGPEAGQAPRISPGDAQVLALVANGADTAPAIAAALQCAPGAVHTRLCRMKARGLVRRTGRSWLARTGKRGPRAVTGDLVMKSELARRAASRRRLLRHRGRSRSWNYDNNGLRRRLRLIRLCRRLKRGDRHLLNGDARAHHREGNGDDRRDKLPLVVRNRTGNDVELVAHSIEPSIDPNDRLLDFGQALFHVPIIPRAVATVKAWTPSLGKGGR